MFREATRFTTTVSSRTDFTLKDKPHRFELPGSSEAEPEDEDSRNHPQASLAS